uniref:Uncharacterized protein n=1 Tax=Cannabis sativa TaxID=3483 RepID=A0A803P0M4_CANSA
MGPVLSLDKQLTLLKPFAQKEIKKLYSVIPSNKLLGQDNFSAGFTKNRHEVGRKFAQPLVIFFNTNQIPQELRSTAITLIPKVDCPTSAINLPIRATILHKCISKLLCLRLAKVLPQIVQ